MQSTEAPSANSQRSHQSKSLRLRGILLPAICLALAGTAVLFAVFRTREGAASDQRAAISGEGATSVPAVETAVEPVVWRAYSLLDAGSPSPTPAASLPPEEVNVVAQPTDVPGVLILEVTVSRERLLKALQSEIGKPIKIPARTLAADFLIWRNIRIEDSAANFDTAKTTLTLSPGDSSSPTKPVVSVSAFADLSGPFKNDYKHVWVTWEIRTIVKKWFIHWKDKVPVEHEEWRTTTGTWQNSASVDVGLELLTVAFEGKELRIGARTVPSSTSAKLGPFKFSGINGTLATIATTLGTALAQDKIDEQLANQIGKTHYFQIAPSKATPVASVEIDSIRTTGNAITLRAKVNTSSVSIPSIP